MPRLKDKILNCAAYLYPDYSSAAKGVSVGGSGFLIGTSVGVKEPVAANEQPDIKLPVPGASHVYVVTNAHVIVGGDTCIRLNREDKKFEVLITKQGDWVFHENRDDLAVYYLGLYDVYENPGFGVIPPTQLLSKTLSEKLDIGIGDEVFTVGRFISHDRKQYNEPSVRFGRLSMMPGVPVDIHWTRPTKKIVKQESFLVDGWTMGGYSGSPVFIWTPPYELILPIPEPTYRQRVWHAERQSAWLLGICWGFFFDKSQIVRKKGNDWERFDGLKADTNTGMMGVVPCWKLIDVLNDKRLRDRRIEEEGKYSSHANGAACDSSF